MSYASNLKELLNPGTLMVFFSMFIAYLTLAISFIIVTNKKSKGIAIGLTIITFLVMVGLLAISPAIMNLF